LPSSLDTLQNSSKERQAIGIALAKKRGVYKGRQRGTTKATPERALALRKQGLKPSEIANALGVKERTVFNYLRQGNAVEIDPDRHLPINDTP
jgi:DNA invertase Pin-like site-specific DNA recombinase